MSRTFCYRQGKNIKSTSYNNEKLKELLILSQKGDQTSYRLFLKSILPIISSITHKKVFNQDDTSDVIQEILLSIHKSLATYDPKRDVLPWIIAITQRRIVDYIRKATRKREVDILLLNNSEDVTIQSDQTKFDTEKLKVLDHLPNETRKAIVLTKIKGYSTKEAANILGIKENALRTKISRGMAKLKKEVN